MSNSQPKSPIQIFDHKVVSELTTLLKTYHKSEPLNSNNTTSLQPVYQLQAQYFVLEEISLFLYDVLELENASIDFIMRDIFECEKKSVWHLQEILRTVIDVQFVITVNNVVLAMNNQADPKAKQPSLVKINPNHLVQMIHDNCFFLQHSSNAIPKQLIASIVQQISSQNGNKGYILLIEYKTYMVNKMVNKHTVRKLSNFTPIKSKPFTPINKDKYNENSQSIKEVDEESQMMERSKRNFSTISVRENQLQLDQYSKIKASDVKQNLFKEVAQPEVKEVVEPIQDVRQGKGVSQQSINRASEQSINKFSDQSIFHQVQQQLWQSMLNQFPNQMPAEQFISKANQFIETNLNQWSPKYKHKLNQKIVQLPHSNDQRISILISIIGQMAFKIHHDQIISHPNLTYPQTPYFLSVSQLTSILINSYARILYNTPAKLNLSRLAQFVVNSKGQIFDQIDTKTKYLSFKDTLKFFQDLIRPSSH